MSVDIFISYASQDAKVARTICTALESRGFTCWISTRNIQPGENFQSAIVRAIRGAKVLLLVFTANSNRSEEMTKELALASQQKLMVVPLRVENVDPSDAFAYEFATRQWIDLFSDWEQAMNNLCSRLTAALSDDRSHVDTIVLGKPSLRDPAGRNLLARVKVSKRNLAIGAAAAVVIALGLGFVLVGGKPEAQAAAPLAAERVVAAPVIAAPAPAEPLVAEIAEVEIIPEAESAPVVVEAPKPRPKPKPKANLPY
ncbi:MAG: toll/interleukin-1 receptor domain-containing protein [Pseudomonadota bacterium]